MAGEFDIVTGDFDTVAGEFDIVADEFDTAAGEFDIVAGEFDIVAGDFDIVAGDFDTVAGDFDIVAGDFDIVTGDFDTVRGDFDLVKGDFNSVKVRFSSAKMRKAWKCPTFCLLLLLLGSRVDVSAQTLHARISVILDVPARVRIEAEFPHPTNVLSFRNSYAGALGLGERIEAPEAIKANGERVSAEKRAPGEFQTGEEFTHFTYQVNLTKPSTPSQMSHVSWLNQDQGLLMLADLLPQFTNTSSADIKVEVPNGWIVASNTKDEGAQFSTEDPENAVFLVGPAVHEKSERVAATNFSLVASGKWPFAEKDAIKIAGEILEQYSRVTRFQLKSNAVLMLIPYPGEVGPQSWTAETRGNVVVLLLGRQANRKRVLSRLGIVLSHELFHLWLPNSLKLDGDYDWFFEGFTLYQALRTDLRLGLISFDDYLETIAKVYAAYLASPDRDRLSLLDASERRWTTSSGVVYQKGMLVGFLYDLSLRRVAGCGESIDDVYRDLFALPQTGQRNANETIIKLLSKRDGLQSFARDYVESAARIDLEPVISAYGIQMQPASNGMKLVVARDLSKDQRRLLGCIGYRK